MVTDEPYFGTYILCNNLKLFKDAKMVLNSTRPLKENTHPLIFLKGCGHQKSESANRQWRESCKCNPLNVIRFEIALHRFPFFVFVEHVMS